ncbi:hypothetical protein NA57DRAFT_60659 [Rhizodiscina lignyota]|uniref:HMG box domain-containing protein n=1 Tax=Rhizodiscina lignyota TaxID=1504668 RepID=A0A9P4I685_9PEZI|nr:hypothetical protein NA57DRAFT_60659 [Rhizodiscina lignyota]
MLCRGVFGRLASEATKQSTTDVTHLARHLRRVHLSNNVASLVGVSRAQLLPLTRSYTATTVHHVGRPKKGSPGEKAAKTRTRSAATETPAKKRASPKTKAAATKEKEAPKRKVLTKEEKEAAAEKKKVKELRALKKTALLGKEPKKKPYTAWTVFNSENMPKGTIPAQLGGTIKENSEKYRALTPSEKEHYNHLANQNKSANEVEYKNWVESHTPEAIRQAQLARRRLKTLLKPKKGSNAYSLIHDERQVKRPTTVYSQYIVDRFASGDFKAISFGESSKLITSEFKALSPSEKQKYKDLYETDIQRYKDEFKQVYGHDAPMFNHSSTAHATDAATA